MPLALPGIEITRLLREDAVGACWAARTAEGARTLRALREPLVGREEAHLLFREEARRLRGLAGPGVLRTVSVAPEARWPWLLTEASEAPDLDAVVASEGPLAPDAALQLAGAAAAGLAVLEQREQAHLAPIPSRLVRLPTGWTWLTFRDVAAEDEAKQLKGKRLLGPRYAPPEWDATHPAPLRAGPWASWALGGLVCAALRWGPPRDAEGKPAARPEDLPAPLAQALARLLDPDPAARPATAQAALRLLTGGDAPASPTPSGPPRPRFAAPIPRHKRQAP
jgi:eukaryotic-like serine/threonine-protein kinase